MNHERNERPGPPQPSGNPANEAVGVTAGDLRQRPTAALVGEIFRRRGTGLLELGADIPRRLFFEGGRLAATTSPIDGEKGTAVLIAACALREGPFRFVSQTLAPSVPRLGAHPLPLILQGVARAYPAAWVRNHLSRHASEMLLPAPELAAAVGECGLDARGLQEGPVEMSRILEGDDGSILLAFGLLAFGAAKIGRAQESPGSLPAAEREAIEAESARVDTEDHYAVLGVAKNATDDELKAAYFAAARRWHTDAYAGRELGALRASVERIFARVNEAFKILSNPEQRAEHDVFLERKAAGLPTDVATVFQAEEAFIEAQRLFRASRYGEAEARLRQAVRLNPAEAEFWAYLGACCHRLRGTAAVEEARECFARARALIPQSLVTEFLEAQLEIGEGELDAAEKRLRKILERQPDHVEAARELRRLGERRETSQGPRGLFDKLLKRK